jgi:hypothetical protein
MSHEINGVPWQSVLSGKGPQASVPILQGVSGSSERLLRSKGSNRDARYPRVQALLGPLRRAPFLGGMLLAARRRIVCRRVGSSRKTAAASNRRLSLSVARAQTGSHHDGFRPHDASRPARRASVLRRSGVRRDPDDKVRSFVLEISGRSRLPDDAQRHRLSRADVSAVARAYLRLPIRRVRHRPDGLPQMAEL